MYVKWKTKFTASESKYLCSSSKYILFCLDIIVYFFVLVSIWSILLRFSASSIPIMAAWEPLSVSVISKAQMVFKNLNIVKHSLHIFSWMSPCLRFTAHFNANTNSRESFIIVCKCKNTTWLQYVFQGCNPLLPLSIQSNLST